VIKLQLFQGNCKDVLPTLPKDSVDLCCTSPPYWGLRDFKIGPSIWDGKLGCCHDWFKNNPRANLKFRPGKSATASIHKDRDGWSDDPISSDTCVKCGAWRGALGFEPHYNDYIKHLCDIFDLVPLKKSGSLFVNIGDTYAGSWGSMGCAIDGNARRAGTNCRPVQSRVKDIREKSLVGIPDRFKIEMITRGWVCRNEIIWHKPSCVPSSALDRFTVDFEKIYFFTKNPTYYFKTQYEPFAESSLKRHKQDLLNQAGSTRCHGGEKLTPMKAVGKPENGRIKRCVWTIYTAHSDVDHFAVYPEDLISTPIKAACPPGGTVCDPFAGSGTTMRTALKLGCSSIGIEMNPKYVEIIKKSLNWGYSVGDIEFEFHDENTHST
jgi:site-specific DNA-methyltransferase (adenine-specific)